MRSQAHAPSVSDDRSEKISAVMPKFERTAADDALDIQDTPAWEASAYARAADRRSILDDLVPGRRSADSGLVELLFFVHPTESEHEALASDVDLEVGVVDMDDVWSFGETPIVGCLA